MAAPAAVLSILVRANTGSATTGLMRFNTQLGATEGKANKALGAVKTLAKGAAIGAAGGIGYAVKKAADFEQQLDSLGAVADATGRQMGQLRKQAMKAGADTKYSALEAAKAQTELAKGGLSVSQIMKGGLKSSLALAAAGELELADAAETTANAIKLFGLEGKDTMRVADALATAANKTTADVEDFAMALKQGGGVAKMAGLSFTETVLALEALAETGVRNSDAGTSMKTAFIQLLKPSAKQAELAKELGLNFVNSAGSMKNMTQISEMLRSKLGGMTKAQRTAALATLAGTDGVRTLNALYAAGPAKLDNMRKGLDKTGTAAETAAKKQDNLKGKLENLQGSVETAAIAIGSKMLPALTKAAEEITKVINDPKLSGGEKFAALAKMAGDAFSAAIPKVADAAAKAAPVVLRAFLDGFRNSSLWGKLIIGGFLLAKMGGLGPFRSVGMRAGGAMGSGMATGAANTAGAQLPGKFAGLRSRMAGIGKNVLGAALVMGIADAVTKQGISGIGDRFQQGASTASLGLLPAPKDIDTRMQTIASRIQAWKRSGQLTLSDPANPDNSLIKAKDLSDFTGRQKQMLVKMAEIRNTATRLFGPGTKLLDQAWSNPDKGLRDFKLLETNMNRLKNHLAGNTASMARITGQNMRLIAQTMGLNSKSGRTAVTANMKASVQAVRDAMSAGDISAKAGMKAIRTAFVLGSRGSKTAAQTNFRLAREAIESAVSSGQITSKQGLKEIARLFRSYLAQFGIKGNAADTYLRSVPKSSGGGGHAPPTRGLQRGGALVPGQGSGDKVHMQAMVEPGEKVFVLNRNASSTLDRLQTLNRAVPRFAKGGEIGRQVVHGPDSSLKAGVQRGLDINTAAANKKLQAAKSAQEAKAGSGPSGDPTGVKGVVSYGGLQFGIAKWVLGALQHAKKKGVNPTPTSGYRPHWYNVQQGRNYRSEHEGTQYPGGAVDFGGYTSGLAAKMSVVAATADYKHPLLAPKGFKDDGHASGTGYQRGGIVGMQNGGLLAGLNKRFPAHYLGQAGKQLSSTQVRAVAEKWGGLSPARAWKADQITRGESTRRPGIIGRDPGGTLGIGLWQITRGVQGALGKGWIDSRGGDAGMRNPKGNAEVMSLLSNKGANWGNWVRTKFWGATPPKNVKSVLGSGAAGPGGKKQRRAAKGLKRTLRRIKGIGLSSKTEANLKKLTQNAAIYGEFADRAGSLTGSEEGATPGLVNGVGEAKWLQKQLETLFSLRNALIRAEQLVVAKREQAAAELVKAGKVVRNKKLPAATRKAYREKVIPALKKTRSGLNTRRGELLTDLTTVQGVGSPMGVLAKLPAVGVLGGDIFTTQTRLRDLAVKPAAVTDTAAGGVDTGKADLLAGLLREANLRTAVSQSQYDVFRNMPRYGGEFAQGGVVPGPAGAPRMILAHGGETVTPGGGGVKVIVNGDIVGTPAGKDPVEVVLGDRRFKAAVQGARVSPRASLPGRGGGV